MTTSTQALYSLSWVRYELLISNRLTVCEQMSPYLPNSYNRAIRWTDRAQPVRSPALAIFHAAICDVAAHTLIETRNNCED